MIQLINISEEQFYSDKVNFTLFEHDHSFNFGKIELNTTTLKFAWNSKDINPEIKIIDELSVFFIGVDTFIVGYDFSKLRIVFFLNTSTNFKWFDSIANGIAAVTETGIILINTTNRFTLRSCNFFGDIIMGTQMSKDKMKVSFLINDDKIINT